MSVTNRMSDWRYMAGVGGEIYVHTEVDWPLTGYSLVGHIYLYSVPALELTGIEVTQVVQDLNNSVPLIAHKPTYVRAHVRSLMQGVPVNNVTVKLSAYRDGVLLGRRRPVNLSNGYIDITRPVPR